AEWEAVFAAADCCVEPVLHVREMLEHPLTRARGMVVEVPAEEGSRAQVASPFKFSRSQPVYRHTGVKTGRDTRSSLLAAGFSERDIDELAADGTFG
ncbi:MAG: CoA transferase, partial [Candidatus Geothermincolia bacterium]